MTFKKPKITINRLSGPEKPVLRAGKSPGSRMWQSNFTYLIGYSMSMIYDTPCMCIVSSYVEQAMM